MKYLSLCSTIFFLLTNFALAQSQLAKEIWSSPEIIIAIDQWAEYSESPSIDPTGNKLYFEAGGIAVIEKTDTGWGTPKMLNSNINQNLARTPYISLNGKRLFFSWYVGGWDLYYSDWDSINNDWGTAKSCGQEVNDPFAAEIGCTLPDDTTLIFLRNNYGFISYWDTQNKQWGHVTGFPTSNLATYSTWGIYVSPSREKYYHILPRTDTIDQDLDIYVTYKDTNPNNPRGYTIPYILNIYIEADSLFKSGIYKSRIEGFPNLTQDGKTMYFAGGYTGQFEIYVSHMLVDENGNPVSVKNKKSDISESNVLFSTHPNPFNSTTKISYSLSKESYVTTKVYDTLGREVATLENEKKNGGEYEIEFNAEGLSGGVYFIVLNVNKEQFTAKIIYLK